MAIFINCLNCNVLLKQPKVGTRKKFCSNNCRYIWWDEKNYSKRKKHKHICQWCGDIFFHRRKKMKYCSQKCSSKAYSDLRIKKAIEKIKYGEKQCQRCNKNKPLTDFNKSKHKADGYSTYCKQCFSEYWTKYYSNGGKEKIRARRQTPEYKESARKRNKTEKCKQQRNEYEKERARKDPKFHLNRNMRRAIHDTLKGNKNGRPWETLVGYSVDTLKRSLRQKFKPGMTWENYGEWHIDHKIPISAFNYVKAEDIDFKRCWSYKNLQPLWANENQIKKDELEKPFQPSLNFGVN